jgi:hypothetical protein
MKLRSTMMGTLPMAKAIMESMTRIAASSKIVDVNEVAMRLKRLIAQKKLRCVNALTVRLTRDLSKTGLWFVRGRVVKLRRNPLGSSPKSVKDAAVRSRTIHIGIQNIRDKSKMYQRDAQKTTVNMRRGMRTTRRTYLRLKRNSTGNERSAMKNQSTTASKNIITIQRTSLMMAMRPNTRDHHHENLVVGNLVTMAMIENMRDDFHGHLAGLDNEREGCLWSDLCVGFL